MGKYSEYDSLTTSIIGCAIEVHRNLGAGLLESTYQKSLVFELRSKGFKVLKEVAQPIIYKELKIDPGYRIDILVEDKIVLELKTVEFFSENHYAQILTYMTHGKFPIGYLLNFNQKLLKNGIRRFVL